jgi:hypothetical protein
VEHTIIGVAAFLVKYFMKIVTGGIGALRVDFPNLGIQTGQDFATGCAWWSTLMAPSLPPVISSYSPALTLRVMIEERTIPECAFHEAVQSKVSEYLCDMSTRGW